MKRKPVKKQSHSVENTLIAIGAAGIGVGLMYLLDPDQGHRRRAAILAEAEHALSHTGEALGATVHGAKTSAQAVAGKMGGYAHHLAGNLNDSAHHIDHSARGYLSRAEHAAHAVHDHLMNRANAVWSRAKNRVVSAPARHPIITTAGISAATVGALTVGAGLMFVFDPAKGRARRAWMRDKVFSATRRSGKSARQYGRHLGNRMRGVVAEAKHLIPTSPKIATEG